MLFFTFLFFSFFFPFFLVIFHTKNCFTVQGLFPGPPEARAPILSIGCTGLWTPLPVGHGGISIWLPAQYVHICPSVPPPKPHPIPTPLRLAAGQLSIIISYCILSSFCHIASYFNIVYHFSSTFIIVAYSKSTRLAAFKMRTGIRKGTLACGTISTGEVQLS